MAWVRTAVSLIGFGFTIYKFFAYLIEQGNGKAAEHIHGPRRYAMIMITAGLASLILATLQNFLYMRDLRKQTKQTIYSLATLMAAIVAALGVIALVLVYLRE